MGSTLIGLSLRDLEYAAAVARTRHFGRAAAECNVSQAALSEQLRKLETLLGTKLFERGHRRIEPTPHGGRLLQQIDRVLAEAHGVLDLARATETATGKLRLGSIATLGPYYMPHLLRLVRQAMPAVTLELTESQTEPLLEMLRHGTLDAVLVALPVPGGSFRTEALFFEPFHLVCPIGHPVASQQFIRLEDLAGQDLILLEEGHCLRDQALSLCGGPATHTRQATSVETLWHMIAAGEGISLLPSLSAAGRDTMAGLVEIRKLPDAGRTVALAWRRTDPRSAEFVSLAAALRAQAPAGVEPPPVNAPDEDPAASGDRSPAA